jgi:hypothetical protein
VVLGTRNSKADEQKKQLRQRHRLLLCISTTWALTIPAQELHSAQEAFKNHGYKYSTEIETDNVLYVLAT